MELPGSKALAEVDLPPVRKDFRATVVVAVTAVMRATPFWSRSAMVNQVEQADRVEPLRPAKVVGAVMAATAEAPVGQPSPAPSVASVGPAVPVVQGDP